MASEKLKTPVGVLSYPHLFEPVAGEDGGKKKYSMALVLGEEAQATVLFRELKAAAKALGVVKWGDKFEAMVLADQLHWPFKKDKAGKYPSVPNAIVMNFRSDTPPGLVSRRKQVSGPDIGKPTIITEAMQITGQEDEMYPGCLVQVVVSPFVFDKGMKKGVSFGLNNVQKTGEGARIDGKRAATDDFEADLTEAPVSLDDLL